MIKTLGAECQQFSGYVLCRADMALPDNSQPRLQNRSASVVAETASRHEVANFTATPRCRK